MPNEKNNFGSESPEPLLTTEQQQNPLSVKIERRVEALEGVEADWLEFPDILSPKTDEDGDVYVTDFNHIVRYYPQHDRLTLAPEQIEREKIIDESERQMSLETVMYELVHGSGNPFAAPSNPSL